MRRMAPNKWCLVILPIAIILLVWLFGLSWFVVSNTPTNSPTSFPTFTPSPTRTSNAPTRSPTRTPTQTSLAPTRTPTSTTPPPTVIIVPTRAPIGAPTASLNVSNCVCPQGAEPIYNTFPHPLHTNESYVQLNFLNDRGVDFNGNNLTVWITVTMTADIQMEIETNKQFMNGYNYVYLDAYPLSRGEHLFFTIPYNNTGKGRMTGGRIVIYYENPLLINDPARVLYGGGRFPNQTAGTVPITTATGAITGISPLYQALMEFSVDVLPNTNPLTSAFLGYDYSAVEGFALPVYLFGGYDPLVQNSTANTLSCKKAYVACQTPQAIQEGCPTQIEQMTTSGSTCINSFKYCSKNPNVTADGVTNVTNWELYCHRFDALAAQFNITAEKLAFYRACQFQVPKDPACPTNNLIFLTPTAVIYGCVGQFLLENHCRELDSSNVTGSTLSTDQCTALNRGVCFDPNNQSIPLNGLSCSLFNCGTGPACFIPCFDYQLCYGFHCRDYANYEQFPAECNSAICLTSGNTSNCIDNRVRPATPSEDSGCNSTTVNPYTYPNPKNEYSAWVRSKGTFLYGFSLDERGPGGAFQACSFSTQLDVVIYPACNGTSVPQ